MIPIRQQNLQWGGVTIANAEIQVIRTAVDIGDNKAHVYYAVATILNQTNTNEEGQAITTEKVDVLQTFNVPFDYQGGDLNAESVIFVKAIFGINE
jgi:hypothetical protein